MLLHTYLRTLSLLQDPQSSESLSLLLVIRNFETKNWQYILLLCSVETVYLCVTWIGL